MVLTVLYWVILVLAVIGVFVPVDYFPVRLNSLAVIVLFVLIGLKIFRTAI